MPPVTFSRALWPVLLLLLGGCDLRPYPDRLDEPATVFYRDNEFYAIDLKRSVDVDGGTTSNPYTFRLRPIGATLRLPKNHLAVVTHQYQPWAKQIYDTATIVALLPTFEGRSEPNARQLMNGTTQDRLLVILGSLSDDRSAAAHRAGVDQGTLVLDPVRSSLDVPVYAKAIDKNGQEPFFALPNPEKYLSPLGNAILITCPPPSPKPQHSSFPTEDCNVQIALPPSSFPGLKPEVFGGTNGLRLYYYFNEKHLPQWPQLHSQVLKLIASAIQPQ